VSRLTHSPLGSGHPYRIDPDQRHPVQPITGEPVEIRARTHSDVDGVDIEVVAADGATTIALRRVDVDDVYPTSDSSDGHLAAASGARPDIGDDAIWSTTFDAPDGTFRYRFCTTADVTDWFECEPARWSDTGGDLRVHGTSTPTPTVVRWLTNRNGPVRCRFVLPLEPDDHVIGFGERFHALDQRGHRVDARVFEQYKQQGLRTYLPSPFAVIAAGAPHQGWGFHVDTSRVTDFDVGQTDANELAVSVDIDPEHPTLDLHLYSGPPRDVIAAHVTRIGGLVRPPDWVFRPWMSANEWNTQHRVLTEVERSIELDIPVGVVVIEAWSDEATFVAFNDAEYQPNDGAPMSLADFTFPAGGAWPDPKAMVERLHELDVRVLLWQIPIVPTDRDRDISTTAATQVADDAAHLVDNGL
jgi:hypothetical protein